VFLFGLKMYLRVAGPCRGGLGGRACAGRERGRRREREMGERAKQEAPAFLPLAHVKFRGLRALTQLFCAQDFEILEPGSGKIVREHYLAL